jgi:hypothetical protein
MEQMERHASPYAAARSFEPDQKIPSSFKPRRMIRQIAVFAGATGVVLGVAAPAVAWTPPPPHISSTQATFTIPTASPSTWRLRLWEMGVLEGSATAKSGTMTVAVPATASCTFQADVQVSAPGGTWTYFSGTRATVAGCGPPSTLAGDIDLCASTGTPTTTEVPGGTVGASGPQAVPSGPNPLVSTPVAAGTYSLTSAVPPGYLFVACGSTATLQASGATATETVVVPAGGAGVGSFYVVATASPLPSPVSPGLGATATPSTPTVNAQSPSGAAAPVRSLKAVDQVVVVPVSSSQLALTGLNPRPLLLTGIALLSFGTLLVATSRLRRRSVEGGPAAF